MLDQTLGRLKKSIELRPNLRTNVLVEGSVGTSFEDTDQVVGMAHKTGSRICHVVRTMESKRIHNQK